jgi:YHS domain-containing protein
MKANRLAGVVMAGFGLLAGGCMEKKDAPAGTASAADGYPLKTCVVSGEPLDSMGGPVAITYEGRTVKFCCSGCEDDFRAEPAKFLAKIDAAAAGGNP